MEMTKITKSGCRMTKNGKPIMSIEKDAIKKVSYNGASIKENGTYYFFSRKQGDIYIYIFKLKSNKP